MAPNPDRVMGDAAVVEESDLKPRKARAASPPARKPVASHNSENSGVPNSAPLKSEKPVVDPGVKQVQPSVCKTSCNKLEKVLNGRGVYMFAVLILVAALVAQLSGQEHCAVACATVFASVFGVSVIGKKIANK